MTQTSSSPAGAGDAVLAVTGLSWGVGGLTILEGIDLEVAPGEFLSVIGPNGAGKTSLINVISGVHRPLSGRVEIFGEDVTGLRPADRTRRGLGRTFQTSSLFPGLSVWENTRLAAQADIGGSLNFLTVPRNSDAAASRASEALERVGLADRADTSVSELSHGDKRKLELAVVLAARPGVLLLDEPTAGVSVEETRPLVDLIQSVHQSGTTIVMVEHRMEFVIDVSERIAVMHEGRLLTVGDPAEVMADDRVLSAYLGGTAG